MPIIDSDFDAHAAEGTRYGFSATRLDRLGASEYTLVCLTADTSSSVSGFRAQIEACVSQVVGACRQAPRADNLMLRVTKFDSSIAEVHGFKPLHECPPKAYAGALPCGGMTALLDASHNAVDSVRRYGEDLHRHGLSANGIVFVVTDGEENHSSVGEATVQAAFGEARRSEAVESLLTILVAVGIDDAARGRRLSEFSRRIGFDHFIELEHADAKTLAGLADFVSQHIGLQSLALGSGGAASVSLRF